MEDLWVDHWTTSVTAYKPSTTERLSASLSLYDRAHSVDLLGRVVSLACVQDFVVYNESSHVHKPFLAEKC